MKGKDKNKLSHNVEERCRWLKTNCSMRSREKGRWMEKTTRKQFHFSQSEWHTHTRARDKTREWDKTNCKRLKDSQENFTLYFLMSKVCRFESTRGNHCGAIGAQRCYPFVHWKDANGCAGGGGGDDDDDDEDDGLASIHAAVTEPIDYTISCNNGY